VKTHFLLYR